VAIAPAFPAPPERSEGERREEAFRRRRNRIEIADDDMRSDPKPTGDVRSSIGSNDEINLRGKLACQCT
jgi:hypothetical protein